MNRILAACAIVAIAACSPQSDERPADAPAAPSAASSPQNAAPEAPPIPAGAYTLDKAHASLLFRVDHLGFSKYTARFKRFDAQLQFDPANPAASSVVATVDARSIETDYPDPQTLDFNAMLQGEEWLDAARHPEMTFRSVRVEPIGAGAMRIHGELTFRGVTRPLVLEATYNGGYAGHPMDPRARIGFSARGTLKRSEFGMTVGIPAPGSTLGVGDEIEIILEMEFSGPAWSAS